MNAGVRGKYFAEVVESVLCYYGGEIIILSLSECEYAYKSSIFMRQPISILGVNFRLSDCDKETARRERAKYLANRKHLPKGKSMGCIFKNPVNQTAGKLIENAGFKGLRVGGAVVAQEHANFIINDKRATASEIKNLILLMKNAVKTQYKITLEEEIRYLD